MTIKKRLFLFLGFLFLSSQAFSQSDSVWVKLKDELTLDPISGFSVAFPPGKVSAGPSGKILNVKTTGSDFSLHRDLDPALVFKVEASGYYPLEISFGEIQAQGFTIFMKPRSVQIGEVVLTSNKFMEAASDIPHQLQVIKSRDVAFQNPQTSAQMLQANGQVFVQMSQMGGGSPNLRGFEANKVLIVVDGIRMNNAIYRSGHLQNVITLDPNLMERTEVLFGPASVIYGSDALGGVMHFYTRGAKISQSDDPEVNQNSFLRYSSANQEFSGHLDLNLGYKRIAFLTSVTGARFGDLRAGGNFHRDYPDFGKRPFYASRINGRDTLLSNDDPNVQVPTGYDQVDVTQKVYFVSKNFKHQHKLNFQYSTSSDVPRYDRQTDPDGNGGLRFAEWYYGPQERMLVAYQGDYYASISQKLPFDRLKWSAAWQDIEESRINRRFGNPLRRHRIESVDVYSFNLDAVKQLPGEHEMSYGLEFAHNDVGSRAFAENIESGLYDSLDTRYPDGGSSMQFLAAFFSHRWEILDNLILSDGIRLSGVWLNSRFRSRQFFSFLPDEVNQQSLAPSGSLGLVWMPGGGWRFATVAGTGFRAPNVDDVGKTFDSEPGKVILPNPDLGPEYTLNGELTVEKQFGDRARIGVTGFVTRIFNALVVTNSTVEGADSIVYDGILSQVQRLNNTRTARIFGASAFAEVEILRNLGLKATVTRSLGRDVFQDVPLDHIPPLFGRLSLQYFAKKLRLEAWSMFNGWKRIEDFSPSGEDNQRYATPEGFPAWFTLNFRAAYTLLEGVKLQCALENILDRHYRNFASGVSAPGRNFILTLRTSF